MDFGRLCSLESAVVGTLELAVAGALEFEVAGTLGFHGLRNLEAPTFGWSGSDISSFGRLRLWSVEVGGTVELSGAGTFELKAKSVHVDVHIFAFVHFGVHDRRHSGVDDRMHFEFADDPKSGLPE